MLSKYLFFAAGRVAPPLVECMVSQQQQQQQQQQQPPVAPNALIAGFIPVVFEACMPFPPMGTGALQCSPPLLAPVSGGRAGDWQCICGFSNFASRTACFGCQRPKAHDEKSSIAGSNTVKPGDWSCGCGTHNFARRTSCMTCDAPKPIVSTYPTQGSERILPGDWKCPACQAHNFRSRGSCVRCSTLKPANLADIVAPTQMVPWTCAACHTANPSSRRDCEICGVTRPNDPIPATFSSAPTFTSSMPHAAMPTRTGDWTCPQCQFSNFSTRSTCKDCNGPRPVDAGAVTRAPAQEMKKGDWACSCGYHNFAKRIKCFGCQLPRPAVTFSSSAATPTAGGAMDAATRATVVQ